MYKYEVYKINLVYICFTAIAVVNIYKLAELHCAELQISSVLQWELPNLYSIIILWTNENS